MVSIKKQQAIDRAKEGREAAEKQKPQNRFQKYMDEWITATDQLPVKNHDPDRYDTDADHHIVAFGSRERFEAIGQVGQA